MTRAKALSLALALQLLALVLLNQTWFSVSMAPNGSVVSLGDFDGATTYPVSMPIALLIIASTLVAAISTSVTRRIALAVGAVGSIAAVAIVTPQMAAKSIAALDQQLDRLTGIANTHGITELNINSAAVAWVWAVAMLANSVWMAASIFWSGKWQQRDRAQSKVQGKNRKVQAEAVSPIELWDDQRS